jgi:heterotetrameric sarcosine oxidase gamma subunit
MRQGSASVASALTRRSALDGLAIPGHYGADKAAGVTLASRNQLALAMVIARRGQYDRLAARVLETFRLELPATPRRAEAGPTAFIWSGPGQWLACAEGIDPQAFEARLRSELADLASVSDQSDSRFVVRVAGPNARHMLAKGVMVDLHPRAFVSGTVAVTSIAYIGVHLWQVDATATYELAVYRSFAASFWHWLMDAGAEFGVAVEAEL